MISRPRVRHATLATVALVTVPANLALGVDWRLAFPAGVAVLAFGELCPRLLDKRPAVPESRPAGVHPLSRSEVEVGILAAQGLRSKEIATRRYRSIKTVERQIDSIYTKLDIHSRAELAVWMMERELLPDSSNRKEAGEDETPHNGQTKPPRRP